MTSPSPWRYAVFYVDKNDPRILAPKRTNLGLTLNFGHGASWVVLGLFVLAVAAAAAIFAYNANVR